MSEGLKTTTRENESRVDSAGNNRLNRLIALIVIFIAVATITLLEYRAAARSELENSRRATLTTLRQAVTEIDEYFQANNALPDSLLNIALQEIVDYRPLGGSRFELRMRFGPHETEVLQHDANQPLSNEVLGLIID